MKYNIDTLVTYCNENNITLINNNANDRISRESYITFECITCSEKFNKKFRQLVKTGPYCQSCMNNIARNKIRESSVKFDVNMLMDFSKYNCNIYYNLIVIYIMAKRYTKHRRGRRHRRRTMKGGQENNGSTPFPVPGIPPITNAANEEHYLDMSNNDLNLDESFTGTDPSTLNLTYLNSNMSGNTTNESFVNPEQNSFDSNSQGPMSPEELFINDINDTNNTTVDDSLGGKKRRRITKKRRGKKGRKTRKYRGGAMCFGNGVGANNSDPNNSIYNTNMLTLFPYRPN